MKIGVCATPDIFAIPISHSSVDYIEGHVQKFLKPEAPEKEFAVCLHDWGCALAMPAGNWFLPEHLRVTGPTVDHDRLNKYANVAFRRAARIGMKLIVFGSGGAREVPKNFSNTAAFEQFVGVLRLFAPIAATNGVILAVEGINRGECNFINTLDEAAEAVERVAHSHVKLVVDVFHMLRNGEPPHAIIRHGHLVRHVHLAENLNRAAPGTSGEDFRPFLTALRKIGFDSHITIEAHWDEMDFQLEKAVTVLKSQLSDVGYC